MPRLARQAEREREPRTTAIGGDGDGRVQVVQPAAARDAQSGDAHGSPAFLDDRSVDPRVLLDDRTGGFRLGHEHGIESTPGDRQRRARPRRTRR